MYDNEIENIKNEYNLHDILIMDAHLAIDKSCCIKCGHTCVIGVDTDQISSVAELRSLILHEAGHCREDAFYCSDDNKNLRRHAEYLAIRWAVKTCVPFDKYIDAIRDGVRDTYQLAEYFNITLDSATKTVDYYNSKLIEYINLNARREHAL